MRPLRQGDGTGLSVPGFSEVRTGDGTVLFSSGGGIPDSGDLQARYDATELSLADGDTVSTWGDETGNGNNLAAGGDPQYVADGINGNAVVQYDGTDDFHNVAWNAISQPFNYFIVAQVVTLGNNAEVLLTGDSTIASTFKRSDSNNFTWAINAGSNVESAENADTNAHIYASLFAGGTSTLREDGSQIASGDPGTNQLDGLTVADSAPGGNELNVNVGEILVYPQDKSSIQADIENYLSDKWGITI